MGIPKLRLTCSKLKSWLLFISLRSKTLESFFISLLLFIIFPETSANPIAYLPNTSGVWPILTNHPITMAFPTYYDEISIDPWLIFQLPLLLSMVYSSHSSQNELINTWVKACSLYIKILHGFSLLLNSKVSKKSNSPLLVLDIFSLPNCYTQLKWALYGYSSNTVWYFCPRAFVHIFSFAQKDLPPDTLKAPSIIFISLFKCPIF